MSTETAKKIRKALKDKGFNIKDFSVRSRSGSLSSSVNVFIKNIKVDIDEVKEITRRFKEIDYCEASGEILGGGNTFVFVEYDWEVLQEASKAKYAQAEEIEKSTTNNVVIDKGEYRVVYYPEDRKIRFIKPKDCDEIYTAHNKHHIAEALALIEPKIERLTK